MMPCVYALYVREAVGSNTSQNHHPIPIPFASISPPYPPSSNRPPWQVIPLPGDRPVGSNTRATCATVNVALDTEHTQALLQEVPPVYHTQINDVLLTALVQAFAQWTGQRHLLLDLEGHGRQEIA